MSEHVHCPHCQHAYQFKPELAGRAVQCHQCQQPFTYPLTPPPPPAAASSDAARPSLHPTPAPVSAEGYELNLTTEAPSAAHEAAPCPQCGQRLAPGVVLCVQCGYNRAQGRRLQTLVGEVTEPPGMMERTSAGLLASAEAEARLLHRLKYVDLYVPGALVVIGLIAVLLEAFNSATIGGAVNWTILAVNLGSVLLSLPLMVASLFISARLFDLSFGPILTALLKLCAVLLAPGAVADVVAWLLGGGLMGAFLGYFVAFCCYWALLAKLFDIDAADAWKVILVITATRWIGTAALGLLLLWMLS